MHDSQVLLVPDRLERRHGRMQSEESVEVNYIFARDIDRGPHRIVRPLTMRDHDVEPICRAALKDHHQPLVACAAFSRTKSSSTKKAWYGRRTDHGKCAITKKNAAGDGHNKLLAACS